MVKESLSLSILSRSFSIRCILGASIEVLKDVLTKGLLSNNL